MVVLRQGRLVIDEGDTGGGAVSPSRLRTVRLLPGMSVDEPLVFAIRRSTPPGTYPGHVELAGVRHAASVQVTELASVTVTPNLLVIESVPGGRVEKEKWWPTRATSTPVSTLTRPS